MVSENFWIFFFQKKMSLWEQIPQDMAYLDLKGMVSKIYAGDHKTLLYMYLIYKPHSFRVLFSIYSQWKIMAPRVRPV